MAQDAANVFYNAYRQEEEDDEKEKTLKDKAQQRTDTLAHAHTTIYKSALLHLTAHPLCLRLAMTVNNRTGAQTIVCEKEVSVLRGGASSRVERGAARKHLMPLQSLVERRCTFFCGLNKTPNEALQQGGDLSQQQCADGSVWDTRAQYYWPKGAWLEVSTVVTPGGQLCVVVLTAANAGGVWTPYFFFTLIRCPRD